MISPRLNVADFISRIVAVVALVALIGSSAVVAQEYKEAYNSGLEMAKAGNLSGAITKFDEASTGAKAAGDTSVENSAKKAIGTLRYNLGVAAVKAENWAGALTHFEGGINTYPSFAKNYLGRAQVLLKQDKFDDAINAYFQTMQVAEEQADRQTARTAEEVIRDQYVFKASSALSRNGTRATRTDADEALEHLEALQQYVDPNADVHYYLAECFKIKGQYDLSIENADKALELSTGSATSKAKIYFVKGESLMSKGDNANAKAAFQNALYGSYRASAQHYIETLGTE